MKIVFFNLCRALVRINVLQHKLVLQLPRDLLKPRLRALQRPCNRAHHRIRAELQTGPSVLMYMMSPDTR